MYNMINGVNQSTFYILPMLGKHPDEYPRFRDCFVGKPRIDKSKTDGFGIPLIKLDRDKQKRLICVYTRVGGGNREEYKAQIKELRKQETYITDYDDSFDNTFAAFIFEAPEKWHEDYDRITNDKPISEEYFKQMIQVFPKLKNKMAKMVKMRPKS